MPKIKTIRTDIIYRAEAQGMIDKAKEPMHKCYIAMLYVFGFRVSEFCSLKKDLDITIYKADQEYVKIIHRALKKRNKSGIMERNIIHLPTANIVFFDYIRAWYDIVISGEPLFPVSRITLWRTLKKYNKQSWNHLFRHSRATLFVDSGYGTEHLMNWFNWSSANQAMNYVRRKPIIEARID